MQKMGLILSLMSKGDFMVFPMYEVLLSLQNAIGNGVTPELRAITAEITKKKDIHLFRFFYDAEITPELEDHVNYLLDDVDAANELIQLNSSKQIPVQGELAFLHYEKVLPKFERKSHAFLRLEKDYPHHAIFRLDMQQALLGRVTPDLRHVSIDADPDKKKLMVHFIYDGEISELNLQLASAVIQDSRISFLDYEMESFVERIDYPNDFKPRYRCLAHWRQEWIYKDDQFISTIRKKT